MKKSELKRILKPLINECVREIILDEGVLSGIISEVARGVSAAPSATTPPAPVKIDPVRERMKNNAFNSQQTATLQEHKKKLMSAIGGGTYNGVNLFEGTTPAPAQSSPTQQSSPLAGRAPSDPGVDISSLFGSVGGNWGAHMNNVKEGK